MNKKRASKTTIRNGKKYVSGWINADVFDRGQARAKKEVRSFIALLEVALYDYLTR